LSREEQYLRVGVTGGIGSGKSTVCKLFAQMGRVVISADEIARELTATSDDIKAAIRETFGDEVFHPSGALNRKALAEVVFNNQEAKEKLNAIIHPLVFETIEARINALKPSQRSPYVIIEAALIYESRMDDDMHYVIVVDAKEELRIERVMERDEVDRAAVLARIRSQMNVQEKVELADFVIVNEGTEADLIERVAFIDRLLTMMGTTKPSE
jgi:dephospho-CoA kinase